MFRGHGHGNEDNIRMKRNLLTAKHHITEALLNVFISVIFPRTVTIVIVCTVYKYIMNYPAFSGILTPSGLAALAISVSDGCEHN